MKTFDESIDFVALQLERETPIAKIYPMKHYGRMELKELLAFIHEVDIKNIKSLVGPWNDNK